MIRRNFLKGISLLTGAGYFETPNFVTGILHANDDDRKYWIETLTRIASPVLTSLSNDRLTAEMPVEAVPGHEEDRKNVTYLEALGRTMAGLAPWLELSDGNASERKLREKFIDLSVRSIRNAVTPTSANHMNFTKGGQPLVDAAFLAHALLRAPRNLWGNLDSKTQVYLADALQSTRVIKPYYSNWLLFTAMVEAALLKFTHDYDSVRIDYAVREHQSWYKGDGVYGDGPDFHFDYYNSYVIHPMLMDVVKILSEETGEMSNLYPVLVQRSQRYAEIQERLISPEGAYPPVGRSLAYRCGAFQLLAQMALQKKLPESLKPAQVRGALTAVIHKTMDAPGTFDDKGWLTIGFSGHQPTVGEQYISTGSLYLCTAAFLPLGLPETDEFWASESAPWTSVKAFSGKEFPIDKAMGNH